MGSTVLTSPARRKARGRSVSGRNGGARKPRAPIASSCVSHRMTCSCLRASNSFESIFYDKSQQSCSCLRAAQFCTRLTGPHAASWARGHFAIHVRDSSNCSDTYRSRWGRATCLSNWAQGLNMERLRAQAPWRSHTQTP